MTKQIGFRSDTPLTSLECKTLIEEGVKLFSLMDFTDSAEEYLKYHEKLAEVIKKW